MTKNQITSLLTHWGWALDRWGHLQKELTAYNRTTGEKKLTQYRIKLQATSVRIEVQHHYPTTAYSSARNEWVRVDGAYYKAIELGQKGTVLRIGKRRIQAPPKPAHS